MRVMVRKVLASAVVAATVVGGSFGAVQARTLPVSTANQVAGGAPVEDVGYYRRRGSGVGLAVGAAALGFGLGAIAASRPYYGYSSYGGYGYGYPAYYGDGYYPRRVLYAPRFYGYRRAFYGPRYGYGRGFYGRGGRRFR
jgi:hypothetical protein